MNDVIKHDMLLRDVMERDMIEHDVVRRDMVRRNGKRPYSFCLPNGVGRPTGKLGVL